MKSLIIFHESKNVKNVPYSADRKPFADTKSSCSEGSSRAGERTWWEAALSEAPEGGSRCSR
jgi:hypothetical protein